MVIYCSSAKNEPSEERLRADSQQRRAEQLAAKLRELGVDPMEVETDPAISSG